MQKSTKETDTVGNLRDTLLEKPIFIGGEGRSGTTLMRVILDSHSQIACGPETHVFISKPFMELFNSFTLDLNHRVAAYYPDADTVSIQLFKNFMIEFYEPYLNKKKKVRWADKTPHNIKRIDLFLKLFPKLKFIHMIRDGRDVASSILDMPWGASTVRKAAKNWKEIIQTASVHRNKDYYMEVKYEDLVKNPETTIQNVCRFLEISFEPSMLEYNKEKHELAPSESSTEQVKKPLYTSSIGRWKKDLSKDQIETFNKIAGQTLKELGYV